MLPIMEGNLIRCCFSFIKHWKFKSIIVCSNIIRFIYRNNWMAFMFNSNFYKSSTSSRKNKPITCTSPISMQAGLKKANRPRMMARMPRKSMTHHAP